MFPFECDEGEEGQIDLVAFEGLEVEEIFEEAGSELEDQLCYQFHEEKDAGDDSAFDLDGVRGTCEWKKSQRRQ